MMASTSSAENFVASFVKEEDASRFTNPNAPSLWEIFDLDSKVVARKVAPLVGSQKVAQEVAHFFLFLLERQLVWERRNRGDWEPWSHSSILSNYFFCNNYRELDRGTNYFRSQMLRLSDKYHDSKYTDWLSRVLFGSLCYRIINKIETFEGFGHIPEVHELSSFLRHLSKLNVDEGKVFTGAHQTIGLSRATTTLKYIRSNLISLAGKVSKANSDGDLQACYYAILEINNIGPFFAWQATCDLLESRCLLNCSENDFCKLGNGAEKGLQLIFSNKQDQLKKVQLLAKLQDKMFSQLGLEFPYYGGKRLTLKNIEHALCEFHKYVAIQHSKHRGQRGKKSRGSKDLDKKCKCGESDEVILCDMCLNACCGKCFNLGSSQNHWTCDKCLAFQNMEFLE